MVHDMKVSGILMVKKTDAAFNCGSTAQYMKDIGRATRLMDAED